MRQFDIVRVARFAGVGVLGLLLSACSMGNMFAPGKPSETAQLQNASATPAQISAASTNALPAIATECPEIKVRPGSEALFYYGGGKVGDARSLNYQAVIDKQSRNCVVSNGLITVKMGVVGRLPWQVAQRRSDAITLHDGIAYYTDEIGVAAAVEATTGRPHWVRRLPGGLFQNTISHPLYRITEFLADDEPAVFAAWSRRAPFDFPTELNVIVRVMDRRDPGESSMIDQLNSQSGSRFVLMLVDAHQHGNADDLFDLGCCVGRMGPDRVFALHKGGDGSTDRFGIAHVVIDDTEGWQLTLARLLRKAGVSVDLNKLV